MPYMGRRIYLPRILTNDHEPSDREIVEFYNLRGGKERIFDDMAGGFDYKQASSNGIDSGTIAFCKEDRSIHTHNTDFYCGSQKLGTSAYQNTDAFASADHTHQYLPLADSTIGGDTTRYCFFECF